MFPLFVVVLKLRVMHAVVTSTEQDTPTPDTVKSVGGGGGAGGVVGRSWLWLLDIERGLGLVLGRCLQWRLQGEDATDYNLPATNHGCSVTNVSRPILPMARNPAQSDVAGVSDGDGISDAIPVPSDYKCHHLEAELMGAGLRPCSVDNGESHTLE